MREIAAKDKTVVVPSFFDSSDVFEEADSVKLPAKEQKLLDAANRDKQSRQRKTNR
jgi:hypothetical protein